MPIKTGKNRGNKVPFLSSLSPIIGKIRERIPFYTNYGGKVGIKIIALSHLSQENKGQRGKSFLLSAPLVGIISITIEPAHLWVELM